MVLTTASSAHAAAWPKLPNLNPFAKKKTQPAGKTTITPKRSSGLPGLKIPSFRPAAKRRSNQPSTWQKLKNNLNPWKKTKRTPQPKPTGVRRTYQNSSRLQVQKTSSSWFPSWFGAEEEKEEPPQTIGEFIGRSRGSDE